jgi:MerR family transcriptional regulator, light-induced transcriptional regulator
MQKTILSTVDVARLFDVTETTVKRWADDGTLRCHKTPGGHRKFPMRNVVEFAERNKFEPVGVLALSMRDGLGASIQVAILDRDFPSLVNAFVEKALSPDRTDLYLFFSFLYEHRIALWEIYDKVLYPGMRELGERWQRGEIGINQEHRASYETLDALARLQSEIFVKPDNGKSVVFACPGEELHEIGLRSAAYMFEAEGWTTHYVGARTPAVAVISAIQDLRPSLLALSLTYPADPGRALEDLRLLSATVHSMGVPVVVGGTGLPPGVHDISSVDAVLGSAREILDYLASRMPAAAPSARSGA